MIATAINIGYVVIAILVTANLYYAVRIADIKYGIFRAFAKPERSVTTEENITWNRK